MPMSRAYGLLLLIGTGMVMGVLRDSCSSVDARSLFGQPTTFQECILDGMKGVTSDMAAKAILATCDQKFRKPEPPSVDLPYEALSNLVGHAEWDIPYPKKDHLSTHFTGTIYNKNKDWTVTSLSIRVWQVNKPGVVHECTARLTSRCTGLLPCRNNIGPQWEGTFSCGLIYTPEGPFAFGWNILGAKGFKRAKGNQ